MTTIKQLREQRDAKLAALQRGGQPIFSPPIEAEKRREIVAWFDGELTALAENARRERAIHEETLAKPIDVYGHLTAGELSEAAAVAGFIKEDMERLPNGQILAAMRATTDKVRSFLFHRYATLNGQILPHEAAELDKERARLETKFVPAFELELRKFAANRVAHFAELEAAAVAATTTARQRLADALRVDVAHLPED